LQPGVRQSPEPRHGPRRLLRSPPLPNRNRLEGGFASDILSRDTLLLRADFLLFFRLWIPGTVSRRSCVLTCFPYDGADRTWLHHTRLEVLSPPGRRWQHMGCECSATEKFLCALIPSYAKIGLNASTLSSEHQARGRSSPRRPWATSAVETRSVSGGPSKALGSGHSDLEAPWRSLTQGMQPCRAPL
jgi:hypothetical protein